MDELKLSSRELLYYVWLLNIFLGLLFGFFPLLAGLKLKKNKYGLFGFIGSILGGTIAGIFLSYPISVVFTWLIVKKPKMQSVNDDQVPPPAGISKTN